MPTAMSPRRKRKNGLAAATGGTGARVKEAEIARMVSQILLDGKAAFELRTGSTGIDGPDSRR